MCEVIPCFKRICNFVLNIWQLFLKELVLLEILEDQDLNLDLCDRLLLYLYLV